MQITTDSDSDPGGPETYGSYRPGFGTIAETVGNYSYFFFMGGGGFINLQFLFIYYMLAFLGVIEGGAHKQVRVSVPVHIHARQRVTKTRGEPVPCGNKDRIIH